MKPYTYFIKHLPTGLKYYGSKYGRDAHPDLFWTKGGYFTSSEKVKQLIAEYGIDSFEGRVTRIFETAEQALAHEYKFIDKVGAVYKKDWLNENNGGKKFYNVGPDSPETRKRKSEAKRTPESNALRSAALKGRPKHTNFGKLLSLAQKNRPVEKENARREKIREKAIGRQHTYETKNKLSTIVSNTTWIKKGSEQRKITSDKLTEYINQGWEKGRILNVVTCPHCNLTGVNYNMVRTHFDKCNKSVK